MDTEQQHQQPMDHHGRVNPATLAGPERRDDGVGAVRDPPMPCPRPGVGRIVTSHVGQSTGMDSARRAVTPEVLTMPIYAARMAFVIPEIKVGLAELGGGPDAWCAKCGKRASLYFVEPATGRFTYVCAADAGPELEAILLRSAD
ncbi:hypothetical protein [Nonomuraea bangladeshensis]|uniref:hypothetical protein n=1 Tax=Nonomuraea bangladeshensis TaxID=404385 RepID=UPI0031E079FE